MQTNTRFAFCAVAALTGAVFARMPAAAQSAGGPVATAVEVQKGTASFEADTNVPAVSVHGKSTDLQARAQIHESVEGLTLERIEARIPVKTLTTGLGLRDDHMRKYIFATSDGQMPDVTFAADGASCAAARNNAASCTVAGQLAIRGTSRPFTIALKVTKTSGAYKAIGDGSVTLSAYGIERPSQFGVSTTDDVKLHLEFTAKMAPTQVAQR